jgi:hypothetical protein
MPGADSVTFDVTVGAVDPDGDPLHVQSAAIQGATVHGTVRPAGTAAPTGREGVSLPAARASGSGGVRMVTYTPEPSWRGTETIRYVLSDGRSGTVAGTVAVITPDRPPIARPDTATIHPGDSTRSVDIAVLDNDTDANGDRLAVVSVTQVQGAIGGVASVAADGRHVIYRLDPARGAPVILGTATFHYTVSDGHGETASSSVTVTVGDRPPTAADS